MKQIYVNEQMQEIGDDDSLADLLNKLKIKKQGVAAAVNNKIIQQKDWSTKTLQENDKILIINASQGG